MPISYYRPLKRILDFTVSACVLTLAWPLFLCAAIAIKLASSGPIFVGQERIGEGGRIFTMLRFRTPSLTGVGRFLRATSLDEFPQFWNVLTGDMSLVGPRPDVPDIAKYLEDRVPYYAARYSIKPGITGWAQVHHAHDTLSIEKYAGSRLQDDLYYASNISFRLDLKIFLRTVRLGLPLPTLQDSIWEQRLHALLVAHGYFRPFQQTVQTQD